MFEPLRASIDNLSLGYIITTVDHQVVHINPAAAGLLGLDKQAQTLETVVKQLPDRIALLDHVKYCSIEHKSCSFRQVELGSRQVRVFLSPLFEGPDLRGNVLTLEDITERVEQEHTRELFLSSLVHELRTPLTAIRGNTTLIRDYFKDALKDKELSEIVENIYTGSKNVLGMVNQFLDMARLEEGRIEYDLQEFDAVGVVAATVDELGILAQERGLSLKLDTPTPGTISVVADPGRVKQVLTNLIGNGLKFTQAGGVTVRLEATKQTLEVSVTDTGAGLPEDSQHGLFEKYFQATNNKLRHDSTKSTGLGLYTARLMVEGMGGKIRLANSKENVGSTFAFTLDIATPGRLAHLKKQLYDAKQGVQHAPVSEHTLLPG